MIDNLEIIRPLLSFEKKGDFYMLYILKRKKDQIDKDNHQSVRTIKTYCIDSIEYLESRYKEIITLAELFKARIYIHVQKQNHFDVGLSMMKELAQRLIDGVFNQKGLFESVVGQLRVYEKRWVIDVDSKDERYLQSIIDDIDLIQPVGGKVLETIPTKNGFHIISYPFNVMEFRKIYTEDQVGIQKHNPTLLYYPNSLDDEDNKSS